MTPRADHIQHFLLIYDRRRDIAYYAPLFLTVRGKGA